jgi:hypothetical protein
VSNRMLRDWLEERRVELAGLAGLPVPRPVDRVDVVPREVTDAEARVHALVDRLAAGVPDDPAERTAAEHARWLLAQLLGWHRREDKSMWWEFHRLMDLTPVELVDEDDPIGLLEPVDPVGDERKGKQVWRYRFPEQELDLGRIPDVIYEPRRKQERPADSPFTWDVGEVTAIDLVGLTVDIRRTVGDPHPEAVVPLPWVRTSDHQARLFELGEWVAVHGIDAPGPARAARDLLLGRVPRVGQAPGVPLRIDRESDLEAACRLALALDETVLAIQGPPGSGKTYSGARMICRLLAAGHRVGITGTSHKVIGNLLRSVLQAAETPGFETDVRAVQRGEVGIVLDHPRVTRGKDTNDVRARLDDGRANLAAGTSWLWASSKMQGAVSVLFVDEAGQISLANVLAMARAAGSFVLLGDPQQLDQPLQGSHPPGADRSALAHVLGGQATMPPDRGLFLETTWRLHPALCAFTSEVFYDDRLEPQPDLARQRLDAPIAGGAGPRLHGERTEGADNESPAEADAVAALARTLVEGGSSWVDDRGTTRPLTWDDVLIVAPYNAQVGAIRRRLPLAARVGTVDKFQGQEAPVSIYSMTTSAPELAPRGMDFLYSRHRLNVATSRARCVAIVVASPDLLRVRARTPDQMRLANAFCRFEELARPTG